MASSRPRVDNRTLPKGILKLLPSKILLDNVGELFKLFARPVRQFLP
jgi:hypothetical protein